MGARGPATQYDITLRVELTHSQNNFVEDMATLRGVTRAEVIRQMVDAFLPYSMVPDVQKDRKENSGA